MMRFASLGSGSKGNATLVQGDNTSLLIDCGFSVKEVRKRLSRLETDIGQLDAILVTHEHGDHIAGVGALARAMDIPAYLSDGTRRSARDLVGVTTRVINPQQSFEIGSIAVRPVAVPHDAREPIQFVLRQGECCLGVLTDLGSVTAHVLESYRHCQALILECNHDIEMLRLGPYPASLKERVGGDWGHLNNDQSAAVLAGIDKEGLKQLVLAHLSQQNNTSELALAALQPQLGTDTTVTVADQDLGFDWITLH